MEVNVTSPSPNSRIVELIDALRDIELTAGLQDAFLYTHYPVFKEIDQNPISSDLSILSPKHGIILFFVETGSLRTINEEYLSNRLFQIDQVFTSLFSSLIRVPTLRKSRLQLRFEINVVFYTPLLEGPIDTGELEYIKVISNISDLEIITSSLMCDQLPEDLFSTIRSIIEGTRAILRPSSRDIPADKKDTLGGIIEKLESQIALFDQHQKIAALSQIDGPQRIRGLAGSGKTVILAMKAAMLHLRNPEARILFAFWTKSLYDYVRAMITRFYRMYQTEDPNWDLLHVRHAWGGRNLPGVYYDACIANGIAPITFNEANSNSENETPFDYICNNLLKTKNGILKKTYDYVLLDEGQDFNPPFYWLCRSIVEKDCIAWAYDELQNVLDVEIQNAKALFNNPYGYKGIDLLELSKAMAWQNNDIVLHRCYRNPKEILVVAHAIGFGVYNDHILQMLENKAHWEDLGYEVREGDCLAGQNTVIYRPEKNSPSILSSVQTKQDLIVINEFSRVGDEIKWVCKSIEENLKNNLLPEDIIVICLDDRNARMYFKELEQRLKIKNIHVNNIITSFSGDRFIVEGAVTLSTVYRAKGNEAAMVYIVGSDAFDMFSKDDIRVRNKIFTAFTRAKAWVRITGANNQMEWLKNEIEVAIKNLPNLVFIYPDVEQIRILRREFTEQAEYKNQKLKKIIEQMDELGLSPDEVIMFMNKTIKGK